ncbi:MAG: GNAT family N-acetyltransferase, partial [Candidatus Fimimonas sp.]
YPLDKEVVRLTGCKANFTKQEVFSFFLQSIVDNNRCFFLIVAPDGKIVGESVINDIDRNAGCANFRIAIFNSANFSKGIGSWAAKETIKFAFNSLRLQRLELDVFSFNVRAQRLYTKLGFCVKEICELEGYNDIVMSLCKDDWSHCCEKNKEKQ